MPIDFKDTGGMASKDGDQDWEDGNEDVDFPGCDDDMSSDYDPDHTLALEEVQVPATPLQQRPVSKSPSPSSYGGVNEEGYSQTGTPYSSPVNSPLFTPLTPFSIPLGSGFFTAETPLSFPGSSARFDKPPEYPITPSSPTTFHRRAVKPPPSSFAMAEAFESFAKLSIENMGTDAFTTAHAPCESFTTASIPEPPPLPTTSDLSRSALGKFLAKEPLKWRKNIETAAFTANEIGALLAKLDRGEVNRTSIGWVNTSLRCFTTAGGIKGLGDAINRIMFNR